MPQQLTDLVIDEISLVDVPANASVDPKTGKKRRHAVVAIWKRDADAVRKTQPKEETGMATFEQVLKSATTRDAIVEAVEAQAEVIAKREGCAMEKARAKVWNGPAHEAYERAPIGTPKRREPKMFQATEAEAILDSRARKIMKREPGLGYARACSRALEANPELYDRYQRELAAGRNKFLVPEPTFYDGPVGKQGDDRDGEAECPKCGSEDVEDGDRFCRDCGAKLA